MDKSNVLRPPKICIFFQKLYTDHFDSSKIVFALVLLDKGKLFQSLVLMVPLDLVLGSLCMVNIKTTDLFVCVLL